MMSNLYGGNGSPESINIAEKRGTYVSPPWHTHEISCVGPLDVRSRELSKARLMSRTTDFRLRFGLRPGAVAGAGSEACGYFMSK